MVVTDEVLKVLVDQRGIKGVAVVNDVASTSEARFRIKDGQPTIEIPPASKFSDIHHQATSVVHACSHSQLYSAAAGRVAAANEAGHTDQAAQDRVAAYKAPLKTREGSEEYGKAELAATYATLNRVTAIPAEYVPPPSTQDPATQERWAQTLETRGGMAEVSHDITSAERGFSNDRDETQRLARQVAREAREQERAVQRQGPVPGAPEGPEGPEQKPLQVGGDPTVGAAPPRGGSTTPAAAQTQQQDKSQPDKPGGSGDPGGGSR